MNANEAKQKLSFPDLMERMGYSPVTGGIKKGGNEIWYRSPLSNETDASFHVSRGKKVAWVFKCFSSGAGGTIIDFVIAHEGYAPNEVGRALRFLSEKFPGALMDYSAERTGNGKPTKRPFSFQPVSSACKSSD